MIKLIGINGGMEMSDDLISRKAVLDILTEERIRNSILASPAFGEMLAQRIKNIPTAFDKEEVINELQKHSHNYYPSIDHYCTSVKAVKLRDVIDIIEKGR